MKEDVARNQMTIEMAQDRKHWHVMMQAGKLRSVEAIDEKVRRYTTKNSSPNYYKSFTFKCVSVSGVGVQYLRIPITDCIKKS